MKAYFIFDSYEIGEEPELYEIWPTREEAEARLEQLNTFSTGPDNPEPVYIDVYHIEEQELPADGETVKAKRWSNNL